MVDYEYVSEGEDRAELEDGISELEKSIYISAEEGTIMEVNRVSPHPNPVTRDPGHISLEPLKGRILSVILKYKPFAEINEAHGPFKGRTYVSVSKGRQNYLVLFEPVDHS